VARIALVVAAPARIRCLLLVAVGALTALCATLQAAQPAAAASSGCTAVRRPAMHARNEPKPTKLLPRSRHYAVVFKTNCGSFTIAIDQARAPHAAASFVALTERGFFDRTIFHRIVPGFVIQGGDPTGSGMGGPGYATVDTPAASSAYTLGVVAMAKTASAPAGSAGSQFFIVTEADAGLQPDYAIVGKVSAGLAVVERIGRLGNAAQQPTRVVEIERATVVVSR
jgi:cyclophilin family peptidyl-prolyl cis-trans isomerase